MTVEEFLPSYLPMAKALHLPFSSEDLCDWLSSGDATPEDVDFLFGFLRAMLLKKDQTAIATLKKLSRIPQRAPKTFENFDMTLLNAKDRKTIASLGSLSFVNAKRNVVMIGPTGTGKTHLAMAIGNACCETKRKAYFIKMDELKAKFRDSMAKGNDGKLLDALSKYSCLIIDEVGYCKFDRAETLMFFQMVDRMSVKETGSIILTSNKDSSEWQSFFEEDDALECTLDRLLDRALCMRFSGCSHRGQEREILEVNFQKLK